MSQSFGYPHLQIVLILVREVCQKLSWTYNECDAIGAKCRAKAHNWNIHIDGNSRYGILFQTDEILTVLLQKRREVRHFMALLVKQKVKKTKVIK